jgi:hypothetical protein
MISLLDRKIVTAKAAQIHCATYRRRAGFRLFCDYLLQGVLFQSQVSHQSFQPLVLISQLP